MSPVIAVIGLTATGLGLAIRLAAAPHQIITWDDAAEARAVARRAGLDVAPNLATACAGAALVVLAVPDGRSLLATAMGTHGALLAAGRGAILVGLDAEPSAAAIIAAEAARHRLAWCSLAASPPPDQSLLAMLPKPP